MINYEGSRYLCQALKVNKSLIVLSLKLNRIDDKAGQKMCIDLRVKESRLEEINLAANLLGNMFCESLSEYISYNSSIKKLDISSNQIDESNAPTLKGSLVAKGALLARPPEPPLASRPAPCSRVGGCSYPPSRPPRCHAPAAPCSVRGR